MAEPLVSICIPTFNRGRALQKSLPEILAQRYESLEFIISDNASTDDTPALCREAARQDSRIRYFRQENNVGLYGNHNFCIEQARGEFLCFFHDHDTRDKDLIRTYVAFLQKHPRVGVVCSDWKLIDEEGRNLGNRRYRMAEVTPGLRYMDRTFHSGQTAVGTPGAMVRRSALGSTRFNEQGAIGFGDFPFWFRIAEEHDVGHLAQMLWGWRQEPQSQSMQAKKTLAQHYEENLSRYCDEHLARWPQHADRVDRWRSQIRRYLFWALAYEVGLSLKETAFVDPDGIRQKLNRMRDYRTGPMQVLALALMQGGVRLRCASLFAWAIDHAKVFRRLLNLS